MLRIITLTVAAAALALLAACGGASSGSFGTDPPEFSVDRYSDTGEKPASLAQTVSLEAVQRGGVTTLRIFIDDSQPMVGAALDLNYDPALLNPVSVDFRGLVEDPLELAALRVPGVVGLAQASRDVVRQRRGEFAVVTFRNEPMRAERQASAVHTSLVNVEYNPPQITTGKSAFDVTKSTAEDGSPAAITIYSIFAQGDGDDNGETNASDITAMILQGNLSNAVSNTNFGPAATDYDRNGEVNLSDIQPIAVQYQHTLGGIDILLGDSSSLGTADLLRSHTFASGNPASRNPAPFSTTDWTRVFRTWNEEITVAELEAADTNADGTVFISARVKDGTDVGNAFPGIALTYESGPPNITNIDLTFSGAGSWEQDPPGSGNYIVIVSELSIDDVTGNSEPFAPESILVEATVEIDDGAEVVQDNSLLLWNVIQGAGLGFVDNTDNKGEVSFRDRGRLVVEASAIGNFAMSSQITFLLASIESIELEGNGGAGPLSINVGDTVQFTPTGTFDWDSIDNGNELTEDLTGFCNWAFLADTTGDNAFILSSDLGVLNTSNATSGDSVRVTCEYPGTDDVLIYDNEKRASNFVTVNIN